MERDVIERGLAAAIESVEARQDVTAAWKEWVDIQEVLENTFPFSDRRMIVDRCLDVISRLQKATREHFYYAGVIVGAVRGKGDC